MCRNYLYSIVRYVLSSRCLSFSFIHFVLRDEKIWTNFVSRTFAFHDRRWGNRKTFEFLYFIDSHWSHNLLEFEVWKRELIFLRIICIYLLELYLFIKIHFTKCTVWVTQLNLDCVLRCCRISRLARAHIHLVYIAWLCLILIVVIQHGETGSCWHELTVDALKVKVDIGPTQPFLAVLAVYRLHSHTPALFLEEFNVVLSESKERNLLVTGDINLCLLKIKKPF